VFFPNIKFNVIKFTHITHCDLALLFLVVISNVYPYAVPRHIVRKRSHFNVPLVTDTDEFQIYR